MKFLSLIPLLLLLNYGVYAQQEDSLMISEIWQHAITDQDAWINLEVLCTKAPGRLVGSKESYIAVEYMKDYANSLHLDTVYLQAYETPAWIHKHSSATFLLNGGKEIDLSVAALGPSPGTPDEGVTAKVIELHSVKALEAMDKDKIAGKIIFFNRPMKPTFVNPFNAYGDAVDQRYWGPKVAADKGAAAVIVRSMTTNIDDIPHTGSCGMRDPRIPAIAVSTRDAEHLSQLLKDKPKSKLNIKIQSVDTVVTTYNLVAEKRGNEFPEEVIVAGGHIDAWFNTEGAHDDGAGCVQTMDVLRIFRDLNYENKRTIRVVMFMDEELYQGGGRVYAEAAKTEKKKHIFALESDAGAFMPIGITFDAEDTFINYVSQYQPLLEPYGGGFLKKGFGGVDIRPLKDQGVALAGLNTVRQRYYDYHHAASDTFEEVNFRELQMGTTLITGLIYLIDKYGVE